MLASGRNCDAYDAPPVLQAPLKHHTASSVKSAAMGSTPFVAKVPIAVSILLIMLCILVLHLGEGGEATAARDANNNAKKSAEDAMM